MNHSFGKHALVTAVAIVALLCMTWPAQALKVTTGGMGKHLLFAQWNTMDYRDTYIAIQSPLGVKEFSSNQPMNMVTVMIRDGGMPEITKSMYGNMVAKQGTALAHLQICLTPGDTWTATLTSDGAGGSMLMVGDPGECDEFVYYPEAGETSREPTEDMVTAMTPEMGMEYSIDGQMGFVDAYSSAMPYLVEDDEGELVKDVYAVGDVPPGATAALTEDTATDPAVGDDKMTSSMSITGTAYLVSPMMGFASNYNAVALMCHARDAVITNGQPAEGTVIRNCMDTAEINDALTGGTSAADTSANTERKMLMGRWVSEPMIGASTDVVLTFPGSNRLNIQTLDRGEETGPADIGDDMDVPGMDPVTLIVFDEEGSIIAESRELMLGMAVNMCSFKTMGMDGDMHDHDMDGDMMDGDMHDHDMDGDMMDGDMMTAVMCNGEMVDDPFMATGGTFRIYNTAAMITDNGIGFVGQEMTDGAPLQQDGTAGTETADQKLAAGMDGTEYDGYNLEGLIQHETVTGTDLNDDTDTTDVNVTVDAGPTRNSIPAIGLVMQTFDTEMSDGKIFDQMTPIWHTDE